MMNLTYQIGIYINFCNFHSFIFLSIQIILGNSINHITEINLEAIKDKLQILENQGIAEIINRHELVGNWSISDPEEKYK